MNFDLSDSSDTTILALSWRDVKSPLAGGAEIFTHKMLSGAVRHGIRIIHFSPMFEGGSGQEEIDGVIYLRQGGIVSVIWYAYLFYRKNHKKIDFVIDQCNTHRFFTKFWVKKKKRVFLIFQLTREIWDYHLSFPWSWLGKRIENRMLKLSKRDLTITESQSTKNDLIRLGFHEDLITVIPIGVSQPGVGEIKDFSSKMPTPTFVYVGRYARYKGIDNSIKAIAIVKIKYPSAKLWIVGKPDYLYLQKVLNPLCETLKLTIGTEDECDVVIKGFVPEAEKIRLQSLAHALVFPSVREGWGMIVSEAALVGTPSIVFNSPGCSDAVEFGNAGYLCAENSDEELARLMTLTQTDPIQYEAMRKAAYEFSKQFSWDITAEEFVKLIKSLNHK